MPYVERDPKTGKVKGVYEQRQPGYAEELLKPSHPEVKAYLAHVEGLRKALEPKKA